MVSADALTPDLVAGFGVKARDDAVVIDHE